jgi:DNA-binding response OmpR family regulator
MIKTLMIEDDVRLGEMVKSYLAGHDIALTLCDTGAKGLAALNNTFDCILLDLMLPDGDGLSFFKTIRDKSSIPVIMLTAKGDPVDRVIGLESGADDYLAKPFEPRELVARIKAVIRRGSLKETPKKHLIGDVELDENERIVRVKGIEKPLTAYQFDLLLILMKRAGRVLSREQLAESVRGRGQSYDPTLDRSIDIHIGKIRASLEEDPKNPIYLQTVRSVGYVFQKGTI